MVVFNGRRSLAPGDIHEEAHRLLVAKHPLHRVLLVLGALGRLGSLGLRLDLFQSLVDLVVGRLHGLHIRDLVYGKGAPEALLGLLARLLPLVILCLGLSWWLASMGVFFRDISQVIGVATMAVMFLSPIFYPVSAIPEWLQPFYRLNPLTLIIENMRADVAYQHQQVLTADWLPGELRDAKQVTALPPAE